MRSRNQFDKYLVPHFDKYFMLISEVISVNLGNRKQKRKRVVSATPIPDQLKRERNIRKLTKQLLRKSNIPNPTQDEFNDAIERYKTIQKRVDLEFEKKSNLLWLRNNNH